MCEEKINYFSGYNSVAYYTYHILKDLQENRGKPLPQELEYLLSYPTEFLREALYATSWIPRLPCLEGYESHTSKDFSDLVDLMNLVNECLGLTSPHSESWRKRFVSQVEDYLKTMDKISKEIPDIDPERFRPLMAFWGNMHKMTQYQ
jgi:hypothetical protein